MRVGSPLSLGAHVSAGTSSIGISRSGGAPGTPGACITPPPAPTARQLVILGGFRVDDGHARRLERHARHLGFHDLRSLLQARCDTGHSIPALAQELGVSHWTMTKALATLGIVLPPRPQRLALVRGRPHDSARSPSGHGRSRRPSGRHLGLPGWRTWASRTLRPTWSAGWGRAGRSGGSAPSLRSVAVGWPPRWSGSGTGNNLDLAAEPPRDRHHYDTGQVPHISTFYGGSSTCHVPTAGQHRWVITGAAEGTPGARTGGVAPVGTVGGQACLFRGLSWDMARSLFECAVL